MKSAPARAADPMAAREPDRPVLFVDGQCVLCQGLARWVAHRDRRGRLALSTLQGETAGRLLPAMLRSRMSPDTVVLRTADGNLHVRSAAAIRALSALGGWYRAAVLLLLVPRTLRDSAYAAVARRRRRWWGASARCELAGLPVRTPVLK